MLNDALSPDDRERHAWQMDIPGFGEPGQGKLKCASVFISRCGGVGGTAALYLAAAGVGRIVVAHARNLKPSDLHRQILMRADGLGTPRLAMIERRLKEVRPELAFIGHAVDMDRVPDATAIVHGCDVVISAAPRFEERMAMNAAAVKLGLPLIDAAMYEMEGQLAVFPAGGRPCLACLCPDVPAWWTRRFPVLGAVAGTLGAMAATEAVKIITGVGDPLTGRRWNLDFRKPGSRITPMGALATCTTCARSATSGPQA